MRRAIVISAMLGLGFIAVLVVHAGGQQEPASSVGTLPPMFAPQQTPTPTAAPNPAALRLVTPTQAPTSPSAPVLSSLAPALTTPPASATPSATPSPAPPSGPWSAADCAWATATLTEDQTLDQGTATREGSSYYQTWANRWGSELNYVVTPVCTTTTQPAYNAVVDFIVWNGCAQQTHLGDGNTNDAAWNALWASNYARLNSMAFALESAYDWPPTDAGTSFLDC
jgi:hypothetical protein